MRKIYLETFGAETMKNWMAKQRPAAAMLITGLCLSVGAVVSHASSQPGAIVSDPCVLVTLADLRAVLGVTFQRPDIASDVDSRTCSYESDKFLVSVYTGSEELPEFQKDSNEQKKRHDSWGKTIKVSTVAAPYYQNIGEGRLIVWKNNIRFTVGLQDLTFSMSDEALEAAREKLINTGLSRLK